MADGGGTALDLELKHHHFAISVPDVRQSIDWYREKLGFELEFTLEPPGARTRIVVVRRGDLRVEIMQTEGSQAMSAERRDPHLDLLTHGNKHPCFAVRDLASGVAALKARGVEVALELDGGVYFRDNFGNLFELTAQPDLWR